MSIYLSQPGQVFRFMTMAAVVIHELISEIVVLCQFGIVQSLS